VCFLLLLSASISLQIKVTLENGVTGPLEKDLKFGHPFLLACAVSENQSPYEVSWTYSKDVSGTSSSYLIKDGSSVNNRFTFIAPASLQFLNTSKTDSGKYKCSASDTKSLAEGEYIITIVYPPSKPLCAYPSDLMLTRGFQQEIKCASAEGVPSPIYTWYKNGIPLPTDSSEDNRFANTSFSYDKSIGTLRLLEVNDADAGQYYCNSSNSQGWSSCRTVNLTIKNQNVGQIVGIVFGVLIGILIICVIIWWLYRRGFCTGDDDTDNDIYNMDQEGNDVMLDGDGPHITKAPSDIGSVRPESSLMI